MGVVTGLDWHWDDLIQPVRDDTFKVGQVITVASGPHAGRTGTLHAAVTEGEELRLELRDDVGSFFVGSKETGLGYDKVQLMLFLPEAKRAAFLARAEELRSDDCLS